MVSKETLGLRALKVSPVLKETKVNKVLTLEH